MSKFTPTVSPPGTLQIFRQALCLPTKNSKLIFHVCLMSVFVSILLSTTNTILIHPFTARRTESKYKVRISFTANIANKSAETTENQPTQSVHNISIRFPSNMANKLSAKPILTQPLCTKYYNTSIRFRSNIAYKQLSAETIETQPPQYMYYNISVHFTSNMANESIETFETQRTHSIYDLFILFSSKMANNSAEAIETQPKQSNYMTMRFTSYINETVVMVGTQPRGRGSMLKFNFSAMEFIFTVISSLVTTVVKVMVVYTLASTYFEEQVTVKELVLKVKGNLKGPIVTQLMILLLAFGSLVLLLLAFSLFNLVIDDGYNLVVIALMSLASLALISWLFYLRTWWALSSIVSIVEEGCYGASAFKRASVLIRGRKRIGVSIILVDFLLFVVISYLPFGFNIWGRFVRGILWRRLLVGWIVRVAVGVLNILVWAAMTVYYSECKKGHEVERFWVEGKAMYNSLASADV